MDRYPTIAETKKPIINMGNGIEKVGERTRSISVMLNAPTIAGMDNKKENFAEDGRSKSLIIPPVIAEPDREIPGKTETA